MTDKIPLIDDPARMLNEAYEKGRIAADRGLPRECEFYNAGLIAAWQRGYDETVPRSWALVSLRDAKGWGISLPPQATSGTVSPDIAALRLHLKGVLARSRFA